MKDGTPLVEEQEPNFIGMPSESLNMAAEEDDANEVTIIRKKADVPMPVPSAAPDPDSVLGDDDFSSVGRPSSQRIVVPMAQEVREAPRTYQAPYAQPQKPNTLKVVVLTIIGTLSLLGLGALGFWALQGGNDNSNVNQNANVIDQNQNTNLNTNLGIDSNFNFNTNSDFNTNSSFNSNFNTNIAVRTPTPTPTATPTPRPSPTATPDNDDDDDDDPRPRPTPTRVPTPNLQPTIIRPGSSPQPRPQQQQQSQSPAANRDRP